MDIPRNIQSFFLNPYPGYMSQLVQHLARVKSEKLVVAGKIGHNGIYHTSNMFKKELDLLEIQTFLDSDAVLPIELPDYHQLNDFYNENGLDFLDSEEILKLNCSYKINSSMQKLLEAQDLGQCVRYLVKAFQILRQPAPEYDISYSHPEVPFTIFVSVGADTSEIESFRLSESILHESMHLFLTLIEEHVPLIKDNSKLFYSPWRETERPLRGVLHGLFVFRTIFSFYQLINLKNLRPATKDFINYRIEQIGEELTRLSSFATCDGLTDAGASLAISLLPSN